VFEKYKQVKLLKKKKGYFSPQVKIVCVGRRDKVARM
jgi:hypothetical protein